MSKEHRALNNIHVLDHHVLPINLFIRPTLIKSRSGNCHIVTYELEAENCIVRTAASRSSLVPSLQDSHFQYTGVAFKLPGFIFPVHRIRFPSYHDSFSQYTRFVLPVTRVRFTVPVHRVRFSNQQGEFFPVSSHQDLFVSNAQA